MVYTHLYKKKKIIIHYQIISAGAHQLPCEDSTGELNCEFHSETQSQPSRTVKKYPHIAAPLALP